MCGKLVRRRRLICPGNCAKKVTSTGRKQVRDRNSRGAKEKKEVVVKDDERSFSCQLTDVSATGISVTTSHFIPTYKEIRIIMEIAGKPVAMKGCVRWSIDPGAAKDGKGKLGIFIMDPPREFLDYSRKITGKDN